MNNKDIKRFLSKINKKGPYPKGKCLKIWPDLKDTRCHLWTDHCNEEGYGRFQYKGTMLYAHRVMYELKHGRLSKNECALHKCDNPPCVNEIHLFKGSKKANKDDMMSKRRGVFPKGSKNGAARLTETDVKEIRRLYATGSYIQADLAARFDIAQGRISSIVNRRHWKHI